MLAEGFVEEVKRLKAMGFSKDLYAFNAYGCRELFSYIEGESSLEETKEIIVKKIHAFAKRQETFFKTFSTRLRDTLLKSTVLIFLPVAIDFFILPAAL